MLPTDDVNSEWIQRGWDVWDDLCGILLLHTAMAAVHNNTQFLIRELT